MCIVCATFNPFLDDCPYEGILDAPGDVGSGTPTSTAPTGPLMLETVDASNGTDTAAQIQVGGYFHGTLDTPSDSDWIAVDLVAGQQYTIALVGTGGLGSSNDDPYLRLRDASGSVIAQDDDGGPGRYSNITFTASTTGTFYVDAQSWNNSDAGTYGVSVTEGDRASFSAEMVAGTLLRPDSAWTSTAGTGATVTWSIRASASGDPVGNNPFIAPSAAQVDAIEAAMDYLSGVSGLNFNQVNPGGTSNDATIRFGAYSANDGRGAYAYYPTSSSNSSNAGDVWLNNNSVSTSNLPVGSYSHFVMLHEIGHAIGLAHPGDYNASSGGGPITYSNSAQFIQDSHQYTVMSYFGETSTGASSLGYPDTFMLYDLLAIHELYGYDTGYHDEDTTYGFNATHTGGAYDFTSNSTPLMSVYDGDGIDTIDLSGYNNTQYLDLNEGQFSNIGGFVGNFSIAYGAVIENAVGGSNDDTIIGNAAANDIRGEHGEDSILGGDGKDSLFGGADNDVIAGGAGADLIQGANGSDVIAGNSGKDVIYGSFGQDLISGDVGQDRLFGGGGNDTMNGGNGSDQLYGDGGRDSLRGDAGQDKIFGGKGHDSLFGGDGNDELSGGDRNDLMQGGDGGDTLNGDNGNDWVYGGYGADVLNGGNGNDKLRGDDGADTFIFGSGADMIYDFDTSEDSLVLQDGLWGGGLSASQVLSTYGSNSAGDYVLDFGGGNSLTFMGGVNQAELEALTSFI